MIWAIGIYLFIGLIYVLITLEWSFLFLWPLWALWDLIIFVLYLCGGRFGQ